MCHGNVVIFMMICSKKMNSYRCIHLVYHERLGRSDAECWSLGTFGYNDHVSLDKIACKTWCVARSPAFGDGRGAYLSREFLRQCTNNVLLHLPVDATTCWRGTIDNAVFLFLQWWYIQSTCCKDQAGQGSLYYVAGAYRLASISL